ncbi:GGDEF domain-containing protein [Pseudoalteromonas sp. '520P1 No. 412']|nr:MULTISPECIES: diguanylate cyclase [unclassified Pseudoalteromonas]
MTASFGVAEYFKETPDAFVEKADSALYKAKENGRNRVEIH